MNLIDFLLELAQDPAKVEAFEHDPDLLMKDLDCPDRVKRILKSGDEDRIRQAVQLEHFVQTKYPALRRSRRA